MILTTTIFLLLVYVAILPKLLAISITPSDNIFAIDSDVNTPRSFGLIRFLDPVYGPCLWFHRNSPVEGKFYFDKCPDIRAIPAKAGADNAIWLFDGRNFITTVNEYYRGLRPVASGAKQEDGWVLQVRFPGNPGGRKLFGYCPLARPWMGSDVDPADWDAVSFRFENGQFRNIVNERTGGCSMCMTAWNGDTSILIQRIGEIPRNWDRLQISLTGCGKGAFHSPQRLNEDTIAIQRFFWEEMRPNLSNS